jgi:uncharacterized protein (TIGR00252 family)
MIELDAVYPHYGFAQHKGYGSEQHLAALRKHGPCPLHRFSFKIVPESAPEGTVVKVLGSRLENAPSIEVLERAGTAIGRIKDTITTHDLADLRGIYRNRLEAFNHNSISVGRSGEHAACEYLQETKGFTIVSRNWRAPCGYEIDIIAQSSDCLVFCEVKTAKTSRYGDPATWVTEEKSNRIAKAAEEYIACNDIGGCRLRFDVLALKEQFGEYEVNHIENAFSIDDSFFEEENGR